MAIDEKERLRRWRLVLGKDANEYMCGGGAGSGGASALEGLGGDDLGMDNVLEALYNAERKAGLGASSPNVARWLGDIRTYFPTARLQVSQTDALDRLKLTQMLLQPE